MKKIFFIGCILVLILFNGCDSSMDHSVTNNYNVIQITDPIKKLSVEDLVGDFNIIKLENSDKSLLSGIHQIHVMNNKLYITDRRLHGIYIFTDKGKFISKIENIGQGPEEYIQISSFETDPFQNRLLVADCFSRRLFIYDELGALQKVISLGFTPVQVAPDKDEKMIHINSLLQVGHSKKEMEDTEIHILDTVGKVTNTLLPHQLTKRVDVQSSLTPSYTEDGKLLYFPVLGDTIYRIDNSEVVPLYVLQSNSQYKILSAKDRKKMELIAGKVNTLKKEEKKGTLLSYGGLASSDSLIYLKFGLNTPLYVYYSKKLGRALSVQPNTLKGNQGLRKIFIGDVYTLHENRFYTRVDYSGIMSVLPLLPEGKLKNSLAQFTEEDNPCIINYTLKIDSCLSAFQE